MPPKTTDATQMRQPQISFAARKRPRPGSPGPAAGTATPQKKPARGDPAKLSQRGAGVGAARDVVVKRPRRREAVGADSDEAAEEEEEEEEKEIPLHASAGLEDEVGDERGETKIVPDEREVSDPRLPKTVYTTITTEQDIEVHWQGLTKNEKLLRKFDMNTRYGPAIGITRLARWTRAATGGLDPPAEVFALLTGPNGETERYKESLFKFEGL